MKSFTLAIAALAAMGLCAAALAQTPSIPQTTQPQPRIPQQQTLPQGPITQPTPRSSDPGRPLQRQSTLEVLAFQTGGTRCNTGLAGASLQLSARLPVAL